MLARNRRQHDARGYAQRYADLLAQMARAYPYNWFNFYEFWQPPERLGDTTERAAPVEEASG